MTPRYVGERSVGRSIFILENEALVGLLGTRCPECGDIRFPARVLCPNDLHECEEIVLEPRGFIYEVVKMMLAPAGFPAPYWAGYIDLADGPRMFARIAWSEGDSDPQHGQAVELSLAPVGSTDEDLLGPVFVRVPLDAAETS
jgi:uncharacterized OB-fold protein